MWQGLIDRAESLQVDETLLAQALEASGETLGDDFSAENMPLKSLIGAILGTDFESMISSVGAARSSIFNSAELEGYEDIFYGEDGETGLIGALTSLTQEGGMLD
jgi:hypothetical protein